MQQQFDIPVVLFFFKRKDTMIRIISRIEKVKPKKVYLISDGPRNSEEKEIIEECRKFVEKSIKWNCEIIKNYANENMGVYNRIGEGAKWVFSKEEKAIFLEDDNLPEITFFEYCKELLNKYETDTRILWICGTNYLSSYIPDNQASYMFTKNLLPCGWASWGKKFNQYYDGELKLLENPYLKRELKYQYSNKKLYRQQLYSIMSTKYLLSSNRKKASWDYQMAFSIKINGVYGISPSKNQIQNIGADKSSTHGGTSLKKTMTKRFCGMKSYPLEIPLRHPEAVIIDHKYEKRINKLIVAPLRYRLLRLLGYVIKKVLRMNKYSSLSGRLLRK